MPVNNPKVAVLLAAFNGMQWIEEQLDSILGQSGVDVTVHISIDPSSDGTERWCLDYAAKHPCVSVLPYADVFGGASRNFFRLIRDVAVDKFDYVAFADQDDVWYADKLERAIREIRSRKVSAYSSNVVAFWPDGRRHLLDKAQPQTAWDFLFEAAGPGCTYVFTCELVKSLKVSMLANWSELQRVSLHDWYFYAFARSRKYKWFIDARPSMNYRQHERNQVGANTGVASLMSRYKTIHDGWWFSQVRLIARLSDLEQDSFVRQWLSLRRWQLVKLSFTARQCRRRGRDKLFFFCICWAAALIGSEAR
ncbi:glycosyltransferase [Pseudomonas shahriarae]|uniref:Glycosyltransferase n=1 Tax=Pseudomonas shahriarae TaxID=2745512 RepID=A0A9X4C418_9PSED|nr:glycosyltransferase [Pseudomonas shahriarae]MDD1009914.1 glycosyltransferase [Pseudomonas shahriarae]